MLNHNGDEEEYEYVRLRSYSVSSWADMGCSPKWSQPRILNYPVHTAIKMLGIRLIL